MILYMVKTSVDALLSHFVCAPSRGDIPKCWRYIVPVGDIEGTDGQTYIYDLRVKGKKKMRQASMFEE